MPNQKNVEKSVLGHHNHSPSYTFLATDTIVKKEKPTHIISRSLQNDLLHSVVISLFLVACELILFSLLKQRVFKLPLVQY